MGRGTKPVEHEPAADEPEKGPDVLERKDDEAAAPRSSLPQTRAH